MKKNIFVFILFFIFFKINAYDFNLDLEAEFLYNNYIKNETYSYLDSQVTLTAFDSIQKCRVKIKEKIDQIKFDFDARLYLKPSGNNFEYFIDSAYFSFENGPFVLYAGKQRIKWGVGYTWNPTDKLQSAKNVLDPTNDLEGVYALRLEYSSDLFTPSFVIAPKPQNANSDFGENFRFALQLYKLIGTSDIFINGIYQTNTIQTIGGAVSYDMDLFILNIEMSAIRYIKPDLWVSRSFGLDGDKINYSFVIGVNKTVESSFFVSAEYYYNGWGLTNYQFNDYVILYKMSEFGIKKNYVSFNLSRTWDEKISFSIVTIFCADDSTILLYPKIEYVENNNFNFEIGFIENITDKDKESYYSMPVYNIINLMLKAYF